MQEERRGTREFADQTSIDTVIGWQIADRASRQFLNQRLRLANYRRKELEDEVKWREIGSIRGIEKADAEKIFTISKEHAEKTFLETRDRQRQRFTRMFQRANRRKKDRHKNGGGDTIDKKNWVLSFSKQK